MPQPQPVEETGLLEAAEADAPPADDFITIAEPVIPPVPKKKLTEAEVRLQTFLQKVAIARKEPPPPPAPPPRTERQLTQLELEMEAGRNTAARHAAQAAFRPQPKPDPAAGTTTPVYRPGDYVPRLNSKNDQQRGYKAL